MTHPGSLHVYVHNAINIPKRCLLELPQLHVGTCEYICSALIDVLIYVRTSAKARNGNLSSTLFLLRILAVVVPYEF